MNKAFEEAVELWLRASVSVVTDELGDELVWEKVREKLVRNHRGEYAVIARGRPVGVYKSIEEVKRVLRRLRKEGIERAIVVKIGVNGEEVDWRVAWRQHGESGLEICENYEPACKVAG